MPSVCLSEVVLRMYINCTCSICVPEYISVQSSAIVGLPFRQSVLEWFRSIMVEIVASMQIPEACRDLRVTCTKPELRPSLASRLTLAERPDEFDVEFTATMIQESLDGRRVSTYIS